MLFAPIREAFLPDQGARRAIGAPTGKYQRTGKRAGSPEPSDRISRKRCCGFLIYIPSFPRKRESRDFSRLPPVPCKGQARTPAFRGGDALSCSRHSCATLGTRRTLLPAFQLFRRQWLEKFGADRQPSL